MTVCPVAVVAGCAKCPVVKICPLKTVLGDAPKAASATEPAVPQKAPTKKSAKGAGAKKPAARAK